LVNNNPDSANIEQLGQFVIDELPLPNRQSQVAYRGKQPWLPKLSECPNPPMTLLSQRIRPNGVYIVIADDVETGVTISNHLIDCDESVHVVMVGSWGECESLLPEALSRESLLEQISVCPVTQTDFNALEGVFNEITQDLGHIKGLVYAPGETQLLLIQVKRLLVLDALLSQQTCDFCLLLSNSSGAPSAVKSGVKSAANVYHDTFVHNKHNQGYDHWLSVTFDEPQSMRDKALFKQVLAMEKTAKLVHY
ncbi:MAG: hypothetical protein HRT35_33685, partial [Algicola sp.]|nr:hypothetical protein [Algicola sp.]